MANELLWGPTSRLDQLRPKTLADEAFHKIRDDIVRGSLAPGEKLQPDLLRERYAIGVSPVREALSRLAADGLTVAQGQRGFFVAPISIGELNDITDLRIDLSVKALERSILLADEAWESHLVGASYQLDKLIQPMEVDPGAFYDEWERRNRAFHGALGAGCQSPWLIHLCELLYDQSERYRRQLDKHVQPRREIHDEHHVMMSAALRRDAPAACSVLAHHIRSGADAVRDRMQRALQQ
jgi:GntR family transcriptional regulator, carbon starvation induced regulator